mmetsp:Transcript_61122/g.142352  ORF Transcript_61122/g.142352 Transcript_61122/m.142352 type:complete len:230 (+) Transcript_61122:117-806(+)
MACSARAASLQQGAPEAKQRWQQRLDPGQPLEVHFVGELELGAAFPGVNGDEGLFVEYEVRAGEGWLPIAKAAEGYAGQTQTSYSDEEGTFVFNHPLDIFYITTALSEWPRLHVQVFKLDGAGRVDSVSYGAVSLPLSAGHTELSCRTWALCGGTSLSETWATHMGGHAALSASRAEILGGKLAEERAQLTTKTSGRLSVPLDAVWRNPGAQGILSCGGTHSPTSGPQR